MPYYSVEDTFTQLYMTAHNNQPRFMANSSTPNYAECTYRQNRITYMWSNSPNISVDIEITKPIYGFKLFLRVLLPTQNASGIPVTISNPAAFPTSTQPVVNPTMPCTNANSTYSVVDLQYEVAMLPTFNLSASFSTNSTTGITITIFSQLSGVGVWELLLQFKHCNIGNC